MLSGIAFMGLAHAFPQQRFCIADTTANRLASTVYIPPNLAIVTPQLKKSVVPFFTNYKLPYSSDYFNDARMDMVLDLNMPDIAWKMLGEIKRVLRPGGILTIVDEIGNKFEAELLARLLRLTTTKKLNTNEILASGYLLSETAQAFQQFGFDLFLLELKK
jgi:SAM-dependent methyltransferase